MKSIRSNCFETNSSSTHAIAVSTKNWSDWGHQIYLGTDSNLHIQFQTFDGYKNIVSSYIKDKIAFCLQFDLYKAGWFFWEGNEVHPEELEDVKECLYNLPIYENIVALLQEQEPECQGLVVDQFTGTIDYQTTSPYSGIYEFLGQHNISLREFLFGDTYLIMGRD